MRIAGHLREGSPRHGLHAALGLFQAYTPVCAWPEACTVQWGHGIVPANPFFEAFLPGTFFRGDGETIEAAERSAFAQWQLDINCVHRWGRARSPTNIYLNGAGWCRRCGAFRSKMFSEVVALGHMRRPLDKSEAWLLEIMETDEDMNARMDLAYPNDSADRLKRRRLYRIRKNLFGVTERYFAEPVADRAAV